MKPLAIRLPTRLRLVSDREPSEVRREDVFAEYSDIALKVGPLSKPEQVRVMALRKMLGLDEA